MCTVLYDFKPDVYCIEYIYSLITGMKTSKKSTRILGNTKCNEVLISFQKTAYLKKLP